MAENGGASKSPTGTDPTRGTDSAVPPPDFRIPSRNPLPLSNSQEAQVREIYYRRVRALCDPVIRAFALCAAGRSFSVSWACKPQQRLMNACMKANATTAEQDAAREEWFASRFARQKEREAKALRAKQQEDFIREWWGLPEADQERRAKEEAKLRRGERVHGFSPKNDATGGGREEES